MLVKGFGRAVHRFSIKRFVVLVLVWRHLEHLLKADVGHMAGDESFLFWRQHREAVDQWSKRCATVPLLPAGLLHRDFVLDAGHDATTGDGDGINELPLLCLFLCLFLEALGVRGFFDTLTKFGVGHGKGCMRFLS